MKRVPASERARRGARLYARLAHGALARLRADAVSKVGRRRRRHVTPDVQRVVHVADESSLQLSLYLGWHAVPLRRMHDGADEAGGSWYREAQYEAAQAARWGRRGGGQCGSDGGARPAHVANVRRRSEVGVHPNGERCHAAKAPSLQTVLNVGHGPSDAVHERGLVKNPEALVAQIELQHAAISRQLLQLAQESRHAREVILGMEGVFALTQRATREEAAVVVKAQAIIETRYAQTFSSSRVQCT